MLVSDFHIRIEDIHSLVRDGASFQALLRYACSSGGFEIDILVKQSGLRGFAHPDTFNAHFAEPGDVILVDALDWTVIW